MKVRISQDYGCLCFSNQIMMRGQKFKATDQEIGPTHKCKICINLVCVHKKLLKDEAYSSNRYSLMKDTENDKGSSIHEITVDSTNINCVISTITASKSDEAFDVILRDHFITKDQKVNIKLQKNEGKNGTITSKK